MRRVSFPGKHTLALQYVQVARTVGLVELQFPECQLDVAGKVAGRQQPQFMDVAIGQPADFELAGALVEDRSVICRIRLSSVRDG